MSFTAAAVERIDCGHGWQRVRIQIPDQIIAPQPGQSIMLADQQLPIMLSDNRGNIECLLPPGHTTLKTGRIDILGLTGQALHHDPRFRYPLLIGQDEGIAAMIFFSATIRRLPGLRPLVLLGSREYFPFRPQPSRILVPGLPPEAVAAAPLLEDWNIASRLAATPEQPGCFEGTALSLAEVWLTNLTPEERTGVAIHVSGDQDTCDTAGRLASQYRLTIQNNKCV